MSYIYETSKFTTCPIQLELVWIMENTTCFVWLENNPIQYMCIPRDYEKNCWFTTPLHMYWGGSCVIQTSPNAKRLIMSYRSRMLLHSLNSISMKSSPKMPTENYGSIIWHVNCRAQTLVFLPYNNDDTNLSVKIISYKGIHWTLGLNFYILRLMNC